MLFRPVFLAANFALKRSRTSTNMAASSPSSSSSLHSPPSSCMRVTVWRPHVGSGAIENCCSCWSRISWTWRIQCQRRYRAWRNGWTVGVEKASLTIRSRHLWWPRMWKVRWSNYSRKKHAAQSHVSCGWGYGNILFKRIREILKRLLTFTIH